MKHHNLHWKLLSLLLAGFSWLLVINIQNPVVTEDIKNLKIAIKGLNQLEGKGHVIKDEHKLNNLTVDIQIKGQRLDIENFLLEDLDAVVAYIDLAPYVPELIDNAGITERLVKVELDNIPDEIVVEEQEPSDVYITFESEKSETFDIIYNINGKEDSQYMTLDPIIKTREVEIVGPESVIDIIKNVIVDININDFAQDLIVMDLPIFIYDKDGKEVTGVEKSINYVEVILPIGKKKIVPLEADFNGALPTGYTHTNTIITPKEITIVGKEEIIDNISSIKLNSIFLSNIIENTTKQVDFILPKGVECIDKIDQKAVVTIEVQKTNMYDFPIKLKDLDLEILGATDKITYEILDSDFVLKLSGTAEALLEFEVSDLSAKLDLSNLSAGKHSVPLELPELEELEVISPIRLDVIINEVVPDKFYVDPAYIDPVHIDKKTVGIETNDYN
ncbi:hypothetical protein AN641_03535 [Candidatus Epulonipiscioides gigas]|nr:hypothetical protein AN641_03535 [Epulopiscium sp. SCG-C07WGA-EpuloA2]